MLLFVIQVIGVFGEGSLSTSEHGLCLRCRRSPHMVHHDAHVGVIALLCQKIGTLIQASLVHQSSFGDIAPLRLLEGWFAKL